MKAKACVLCLSLIAACALTTLHAQDAPQAKPDIPKSGYRAEILFQLNDLEKKVVALAEAMPEEKYSWRPADGVRSVGEVFVHIGGANYFFTSRVGAKPPAGLSQNMEKTVTKKTEVIDLLKQSFAHAKKAVLSVSDADLEKETKFGPNSVTYRNVLLIMVGHGHEHLGQSIAYARTNGVTPPWSKGGEG